MRNLSLSLLFLLSFAAVLTGFDGVPNPQAMAQREKMPDVQAPDFAVLADRLLPAVVNISSTQKALQPENFPDLPQFPPGSPFEHFFEEFMNQQGNGFPAVPPASLGSGFIIDSKNGYIVTNNHVVRDAEDIRVTLFDDTTLEAEIVGRDDKMDLAVLKVNTDKELPATEFGNSDKMRVGDWVLAIGNPFGLGGTVTAGIVSARQRDINAGPYDDFIQTDASINRGNSGGPMFNLNGKVIGINTAIFSPSGGSIGIGFAIPSNLAKPVINQLIKYGRTRRGWLGVRIQTVTDEIAESLGMEKARGALVASVTSGGPAAKAGVKAGDIILSFDGKPVDEMRELPRIVAESSIGEKAKVELWRGEKKKDVSVVIGELEKAEENGLVTAGPETTPEPEKSGETVESLGLTLSPITPQDREQYNIGPDINGVLITDIEPGSEAALKNLMTGDVIVEVNQQSVTTPSKAIELISKVEDAGRSSVLFLVSREDDVRFFALQFKK